MQIHRLTNVTGPGLPVRRQSPIIRDPKSGGATKVYAGDSVTYTETDWDALPEATKKQIELLVAMEVFSHTVEGPPVKIAPAPPPKAPVAATEPVPAPPTGVAAEQAVHEKSPPLSEEEAPLSEEKAPAADEEEAPVGEKSITVFVKAVDRAVKKAQAYITRKFGEQPSRVNLVALIEAEKAGKNRQSMMTWLEELLSAAPEEETKDETPAAGDGEPAEEPAKQEADEADTTDREPLGAESIGVFDYAGFLEQPLSNIIIAYEGLAEKPDREALTAAEQGDKNRSSVLNWLESLN